MAEAVCSYTAGDGRKLFCRAFTPTPKSLVWGCTPARTIPPLILIHGIESHSGWFRNAGEGLADFGINVFALDRRGSGLNKEGRGDLDDFHKLIEDIDAFLSQKGINEKFTLVGLCWGAKTALYFTISHPEKVSKLVLITPGFKTKLYLPFLKKIKWLGAALFAWRAPLDLPIKAEMFTDDRTYLDMIREDELRLRRITPNFFRENLRLEKAIRKSETKLDIPCLVLLAEGDEIVDNVGTAVFLNRYFKNLVTISYPACRHGIFFEGSREKAIKDLANWAIG